MGCGPSTASTAAVVPGDGSDTRKANGRVHQPTSRVADSPGGPIPSTPGVASFKNRPATASYRNWPGTASGRGPVHASPLLSSRRGMALPTDAPSSPDGTLPALRLNSFRHARPSTSGPGGRDGPVQAPVPPGQNPCDPEFFPGHMEQAWNHYATPPHYRIIDKQGLKRMAEDAVHSFLDCVRRAIRNEHPRWDSSKVESKTQALTTLYLPGSKMEDTIVIAAHFLALELKFSEQVDPNTAANMNGGSPSTGPSPSTSTGPISGITKPCFFLHFQRAHRCLFSYNPHEKQPSLERELIVQRLNKQGVERANKALSRLVAKSKDGIMGIASARGTRSIKGTPGTGDRRRKKSVHGGGGHHHAHGTSTVSGTGASGKQNMFGNLDFGPRPTSAVPEAREPSTSRK